MHTFKALQKLFTPDGGFPSGVNPKLILEAWAQKGLQKVYTGSPSFALHAVLSFVLLPLMLFESIFDATLAHLGGILGSPRGYRGPF